jgi:hypothetical protein
MSNWYLYIGIFLVCSGIGTPLGIILLVLYFWNNLGNKFKFSQYNDNTYNINNVNVSSGVGTGKDDFDTPIDHISKESREEMR